MLIKVTRIIDFNNKKSTEKILINTDIISEVYPAENGSTIYLKHGNFNINVTETINEILTLTKEG